MTFPFPPLGGLAAHNPVCGSVRHSSISALILRQTERGKEGQGSGGRRTPKTDRLFFVGGNHVERSPYSGYPLSFLHDLYSVLKY